MIFNSQSIIIIKSKSIITIKFALQVQQIIWMPTIVSACVMISLTSPRNASFRTWQTAFCSSIDIAVRRPLSLGAIAGLTSPTTPVLRFCKASRATSRFSSKIDANAAQNRNKLEIDFHFPQESLFKKDLNQSWKQSVYILSLLLRISSLDILLNFAMIWRDHYSHYSHFIGTFIGC